MSKKALNSSKNLMGRPDSLSEDFEFLSLFIEEALNGVDVARRYSNYYQKLLTNRDLRRSFLDIIQLMEDDLLHALETLPEPVRSNLQFLLEEKQVEKSWQFKWQRSLEQLQEIFAPPQLAYRAASDLGSGEEIRVFQDEFIIDNNLRYSITISCVLSELIENGLDIILNVGISTKNKFIHSSRPIEITLNWGNYKETVIITKDGRHPLPTIPLNFVFDNSIEHVTSALELTIDIPS